VLHLGGRLRRDLFGADVRRKKSQIGSPSGHSCVSGSLLSDNRGTQMWSIRALTALGLVPALLLAGVTVSGARAETASWETAGHRVLLLKIVEQGAPSSALNTSSYAKLGTTKALERQQLTARHWIRRHSRLAEKHRSQLTKIAHAHAGEAIRTAADVAYVDEPGQSVEPFESWPRLDAPALPK
jgi:hypothetical protein